MIGSELHAVRQQMEFSPTWILNSVVQRRLNWTELNAEMSIKKKTKSNIIIMFNNIT